MKLVSAVICLPVVRPYLDFMTIVEIVKQGNLHVAYIHFLKPMMEEIYRNAITALFVLFKDHCL